MTQIKNLRRCAYNPKTKRNEETFLLENGKVVFSSSVIRSTSDIDGERFRVNRYVQSENMLTSRICHRQTEKSDIRNKTKCMEFGADKNSCDPYRYDTTGVASVLDAWKANSTYLSASTGLNHLVREVFVLDIDDEIREDVPEKFFNIDGDIVAGRDEFVRDCIRRKIREITSAGIPAPNAVSLHVTNSHYQMQWYMSVQIIKSKFTRRDSGIMAMDTADTSYAWAYIPLTRAVNMMFGGDDCFTGWRCRNTFCTHLDEYRNFRVEGDDIIPAGEAPEYGKYDTSELFTEMYRAAMEVGAWGRVKSNWNGDETEGGGLKGLRSKWNDTIAALKDVAARYAKPADEMECEAGGGAETEVFTENEYAEKGDTGEKSRRGGYRRGVNDPRYIKPNKFKDIKETYRIDKVAAITMAYMDMHISRNSYWMQGPVLLMELEPTIAKKRAFTIMREAHDRIAAAHGGGFVGTVGQGAYTEGEMVKTFEYGWRHAEGREIHAAWTDAQRRRSAETNSTKYKFRKLMMFNWLMRKRIDISKGINRAVVARLAGELEVGEATVRRMMKECEITPSKAKRYRICGNTALTKRQERIYLTLCTEVQRHLDDSNIGKDFRKYSFRTKVITSSRTFCYDRNTCLCRVDNVLGVKVADRMEAIGLLLTEYRGEYPIPPYIDSGPPGEG